MINLKIKLNTTTDIKEFLRTVNSFACDIDLVKGRYVIDAKSTLGVYTLDLSQPVDLHIHSDEKIISFAFDKWIVE